MEAWNVQQLDDGGEFVLMNKSRTLVTLSLRAHVDMGALLSAMEEAGVPLDYTDGVSELYFTIVPGLHGYYIDDRITLSTGLRSRCIMPKILVHELAHHLDEREGLSLDERLLEEKKRGGHRHLGNSYARQSVAEYLAIGFEVYYFGDASSKKKMRQRCPLLFRTIRKLHRRYASSRS